MDSGAHFAIVTLSLLADVILYVVVARSATGRVGPNSWAGIRTRTTMKSEKTWLAAHVAAYPLMRDTAIANAVLMVVSLFVPYDFQVALMQIAVGVFLVGVLFAGVQGQKAAKAVHD
jgi:hypothetical protein